MAPFPPIFAYTIFFLLDFIAFILDVSVIASIGGVFISFLSTLLYILWVFFRYGAKKATEKLFNLRNKTGKKLMKIFGGSIIPFVNLWAVHDDYKQEVREAKNKELGISEEESQNSGGGGFLKNMALGAGVIMTGGAGAAALAGKASVVTRSGSNEEDSTKKGWTRSSKRSSDSSPDKKKDKKSNEKTTTEEVGGIKTGLNREDYDSQIKDYANFDTYAKDNKEREKDKAVKEQQSKKENEAKRMQGLKEKKDLRGDMLERSQRRFGSGTDESKAMESENK